MFSWRLFYVFLYLYRTAVSIVAQVYVVQLTVLGDSGQFQQSSVGLLARTSSLTLDDALDLANGPRFLANRLTEGIGTVFNLVFFNVHMLVNLGFQTIAFIGLYILLRTLDADVRWKVAILLLLPSFTLWSSIASKESVVVFAMSIFVANLYKTLKGHGRTTTLTVFAIVLLALYKVQYGLGVAYAFFVVKIAQKVKQPAFVGLLLGLLPLVAIYFARDVIDQYSFDSQRHFLVSEAAGSRPPFFVEEYDIFAKAWYGMFQAFYGPTLNEATLGLLQLVSFAESLLLVSVLAYFLLKAIPRMAAYSLFLCFFSAFWLLFSTYPFGIVNAGSAVRYRTGYYILIVAIFAIFASRDILANWRRPQGQPESKNPPVRDGHA